VANDARVLQDAIHPEDRDAWLAAIEASAQQLTPFEGDYRISLRGGKFGWFRTLATPTRQADGSVVWNGVSIDVSELKAAEQALRESEERYRRLIEAGPIALLTLRAQRVSFANAKALELLGRELLGRHFLALVHPDDFPVALGLSDPVLAGERAGRPCELRILRTPGQSVDVEAVAVPISERGEPATQLVLLDITERKRVERQVRHLAHHDPLTGLPNRALLLDRLRQAVRQARRERGRIAVLMLDLDHFKEVNDSLGHPRGDRFLCAVAERLCATIRESDTLARFGGDEFTLVQPRVQDARGAAVLADKIIAALAEPFAIDGGEIRVTSSIGVAIYPEDGNAPEPLIECADIALYRAKAAGRNRVTFFAEAMKDDLAARPALGRRRS
jgi:diguanylate cyclase (GGDEF)-like protein/PAS domain S-box-containing protein